MDENLTKLINEFNSWTKDNKKYIIEHLYFGKIREYLLKEYGGEILSEPVVFSENCFGFLDDEEYYSNLSYHVHLKGKVYPMSEVISFRVDYKFTVKKNDGSVYEYFDVYRNSDSVFLQGTSEGKYPKEYKSEYTRLNQK